MQISWEALPGRRRHDGYVQAEVGQGQSGRLVARPAPTSHHHQHPAQKHHTTPTIRL